MNPLNLIPVEYRALAIACFILVWSALCGYGGWRWRDNEAMQEKAQAVLDAAKKSETQAGAINAAGVAFEGDRNENSHSRPSITVTPVRMCKQSASPARVPDAPSKPDDDAAADAEATALGKAIEGDALSYPDCYALVQRLREAVTAAGSKP